MFVTEQLCQVVPINHIVTYTLATDATHIRISMPVRAGGRINVDYLEYAAFSICSDTDTDTDGDGIVDRLDIDSDKRRSRLLLTGTVEPQLKTP